MNLFKTTVILSSFVAIASRLVGAAYRIVDTLNPDLQKTQVISSPKTVAGREAITIGMAFGFAFLSNHFLDPIVKSRGWNQLAVTFCNTVISTLVAETVARKIAYRKARTQSMPPPRVLPPRVLPRVNRPFPALPPVMQFPMFLPASTMWR